jgi:hypothetical protein
MTKYRAQAFEKLQDERWTLHVALAALSCPFWAQEASGVGPRALRELAWLRPSASGNGTYVFAAFGLARPLICACQSTNVFIIGNPKSEMERVHSLLTFPTRDFYYLPRTAGMAYGLSRGIAVPNC